ncbi:MAG TPA: HD domain-containing protein [Candidatus Eubacterium faecigallinarum]|nr:HD domain-containing protein [Candidatus Eubacterium faecigallinarum]
MTNDELLEKIKLSMIDYYSGDPKRIHHFIKVHSFAKLIGGLEKLDSNEMFVLECAALVHDIGIKPAEEKYASSSGKYQEAEGGKPAAELLRGLGVSEDVVNRVCYLVSHHHTYNMIDGADYQILVESDFIVNLYEDNVKPDGIRNALKNIFKTHGGITVARKCFGIS